MWAVAAVLWLCSHLTLGLYMYITGQISAPQNFGNYHAGKQRENLSISQILSHEKAINKHCKLIKNNSSILYGAIIKKVLICSKVVVLLSFRKKEQYSQTQCLWFHNWHFCNMAHILSIFGIASRQFSAIDPTAAKTATKNPSAGKTHGHEIV